VGANAQLALALVITIASACLLNWGYLTEHSAASALPPVSIKRPLLAVRLLLASRRWLTGFLAEVAGWLLYVLALALAPLSLVQAASAGGIGVLAFLVGRPAQVRLARREQVGVGVAITGLGLLGLSLARGAEQGHSGAWVPVLAWVCGSLVVALLVVKPGGRLLGGGASHGAAAGILFAAGDVCTKSVVEGGGHVALAPLMIASYAAGTLVLQMGFQRGGALTTAGLATMLTNGVPIVAGMTVYGEPLPGGAAGAARVLAFGFVIAGAVFLARDEKPPATAAGAAVETTEPAVTN
jgi:hypothetical protein